MLSHRMLRLFLSQQPLAHHLSRGSRPVVRCAFASRSKLAPLKCCGSRGLSTRVAMGSRTKARAQQTATKQAEPASVASAGATSDERLSRLRAELVAAGVDAFIVPSEDPHQSEYAATCFERRQFISRFTGSAGTAVITKNEALLWTDGRYFLQAERELGTEWRLMRAGLPGTPEVATYLKDTLPSGARVGIDPQLHSATAARTLRTTLSGGGQVLVSLADNPVDLVWKNDRPAPPRTAMRVHPLRWAGIGVVEKLARMRAEMAKHGAAVLVVPQLDEVAWLLNVRGGDVDYNPVTLAYVLLYVEPADGAVLFCDSAKVTPEVEAHLAEAGVKVEPYGSITHALRTAAAAGKRVMADPAKVSLALFDAVTDAADQGAQASRAKARRRGDKRGNGASSSAPEEAQRPSPLIACASPVAIAKAVKNGAELDGMREAHLRDAAALAAFFAWLEAAVASGQTLTEASAADHLQALRAQQEGFIEPSFPTIAGCNANGAIIHYRPVEGACASIPANSLLLVDSGGQYECGTTDVTRTVFLGDGNPTAEQMDAFTRVLQGHIALDTAIFPENTPGFVLDAFARRQLWQVGLDYRHGTGHGVGAALNVHEGPQGISPRFGNTTGLVAGMIVSNEPGYYADGRYGIRIENLLAIKEAPTESRFGGVTFLGFERLTLVPIQAKLLATHLLADAEVAWLDEYHAQCWREVSPRLVPGPALDWLRANTQPLAERLAKLRPHGATRAPAV